MKRFMTILAAVSMLVLASSAFGQATNDYGWTVSASLTDPLQNTGVAAGNLYIWFYCATNDGMAAAEFGLTGSLAPMVVAAIPQSPFLDALGSDPQNFLLAVPNCPGSAQNPSLPMPAVWLIGPAGAGDLYLAASNCALCGNQMGTADCSANPQLWPMSQIGFGPGAPKDSCPQTAVEENSWGQIKSLYR